MIQFSQYIRKSTKAVKKDTVKKYLLIGFVVLMPVIMLYALLILNGKGLNPQIFIPTYNDEVAWFAQIESMITYGAPLGYEGYNATHASIGTFGPWGIATLLPYAFIGKIIGWELHSMAIANVMLLSIAIMFFIFLTKPNTRQLLWLGIGYISMSITVGYSMLAMAESLRYALAIIMAGMMIRLYRNECGRLFTFFIIPLFIIYAIQVYLILALIVPVYVFLILRDKKIVVRLGVCVIITGVIALTSNYFAGLVTSPYTESTRASLINGIIMNPYQGVVEAFRVFMNNLETVNPVNYIELASRNHGILVYFFIGYLGFTALLIKKAKEKGTTDFYDMVSLYLLIGFLLSYCALYTGEPWTLCRGINTAIVFVMFFMIFESHQRLVKYFVIFSLIAGISSWQYYAERIEMKNTAYARAEYILEEREKITELVDISKDNSTWDNTIAHYGEVTNVYLELPVGAGTNYMIGGEMNQLAKWAAVSKCDGEEHYQATVNELLAHGHTWIYENEDLVILEHTEK